MRPLNVFLALVLASTTGVGQWKQVDAGSGVTSLVVVGSSAFAAVDGSGVFHSTNCGGDWAPVPSIPQGVNVTTLASNGVNLFAVSSRSGVFRSSDDGSHWTAVSDGLPKTSDDYSLTGSITVIGTDLFVGQNLYPYPTIYRSTDQGAHWVPTSNLSASNNGLSCLGVFGTTLLAGTYGGNPDCGFFLSTNSGATWVQCNNGLQDSYGNGPSVYSIACKDSTLFIGTSHGVFLSTNIGKSWKEVNIGLPAPGPYAREVRCLAFRGTDLFAGTSTGGLFFSTNGGASWTEETSGLMAKDILSLCVCGSTVLAGTGCGLFYSSDSTGTWSVAHGVGPFLSGFIGPYLIRGTEMFVGVERGFGRGPRAHNIFRSTDIGNSWSPQATLACLAMVFLGSDIYAGTMTGVFRSIDSGQHWTSCSKGLPTDKYDPSFTMISSLASDGQNIFAVTGQGIYGSFDKGDSWIERTAGMEGVWITQLLASGSYLFAGTDTGGVFKSADSGATWIPVNSGLPRSYSNTQYEHITCLVAAGHAIFAGTAKGSYRLPEDGDVWTGVNDGLVPTGGDPSVACFAVSGVNLFAGTEFGGAFLSTNNGTSWTPLNEGLPRGYEREQCGVLSLAADDTYLYACPGFFAMELGFDCAGLWRRPLSEIITSVHTPPENMARGFWLSQNYPNPFNPSTTIKYELPKASHVSLMVYDILGRKVSELVNEKRDAGVHEVMFEGMNLASGVYFYRLRAGSFVDVKRFILLK